MASPFPTIEATTTASEEAVVVFRTEERDVLAHIKAKL